MHSAQWRHGDLEFLTHADNRYRVSTRVPTPDEMLRAAVGRPFSMSDKGKYALALQQLVEPTELLDPGITEVIRDLTTPRSKELRRALESASAAGSDARQLLKLATEWGGRAQQRFRSARQVQSAVGMSLEIVSDVLERLAALRLASRGLEIACRNCGMVSFEPMDASRHSASCPGCHSGQQYVMKSRTLKVVYRLNSLVDRASDNGVIGHVLAVGALRQRAETCHVVPGVEVAVGDQPKAELDLLGYVDDQVVAGEIKLTGRQFTTLRRDIELSKAVGADAHVMACVDDLPAEVRLRAESLARRVKIELLILDRTDLRPAARS
jgi:hypothetical protein